MTAPLAKPGLFITATDTEVGKTVITCGIAGLLRAAGLRVGVCKPISSGCRVEHGERVSDDAVALSHAAASDLPLQVINPVRFAEPLAPAVAAEREGRPVDCACIHAALRVIDSASDVVLIEGIGGVLVPVDERRTVLDLAAELGYPVLVVTRPNLGTLNHTALTVRAIRGAGLAIAGLVLNGCDPDRADVAEQTNPGWLPRVTGVDVLAAVPVLAPDALAAGVQQALSHIAWRRQCRPPRPRENTQNAPRTVP